MYRNSKPTVVKDNLILKIFTIGYKTIGESIVILILADDIVKFSAVIDCYETKNGNLTLKLLNNYNIKSVDLICMTHPDTDHCKGLNKVLEKVNQDSIILYPTYCKTYKYKSKSVIAALDKINEYVLMRKDNKRKPKVKDCNNTNIIPVNLEFQEAKSGNVYELEIRTYSPVTEVIGSSQIKGTNIEHNDLSILMTMALGDYKILLCGDVENDTIDIIGRDLDKNGGEFFSGIIDYVKIPHHGSSGAENLFNILDNPRISNSVTTTYRGRLPEDKMLKKYAGISSRLFCTSDLYGKNKFKYGVVETTVDMFNRTTNVTEKKYDEIEL